MKNLIHKIVTDIKFLYPCIAYEDTHTDQELTIIAETDLSRVYPIKKHVNGMEFVGEDFWGRASFKDKNEQFYCEVDGALYFKGSDMDGDPRNQVKDIIHEDIPNVDEELSNFKPCIDKVRKYAIDNGMELINVNFYLQKNQNNVLNSKIICNYKLKIK